MVGLRLSYVVRPWVITRSYRSVNGKSLPVLDYRHLIVQLNMTVTRSLSPPCGSSSRILDVRDVVYNQDAQHMGCLDV